MVSGGAPDGGGDWFTAAGWNQAGVLRNKLDDLPGVQESPMLAFRPVPERIIDGVCVSALPAVSRFELLHTNELGPSPKILRPCKRPKLKPCFH